MYATLGEYRFYLRWSGRPGGIFARRACKSEEEVKRCTEELEKRGIEANVYRWRPYWCVEITGRGILKLAEQSEEWRKALKECIEKKGAPTRGPVSRKLLELAESPPPKLLTPSKPLPFRPVAQPGRATDAAVAAVEAFSPERGRNPEDPGSNPGRPASF